MHAAEDDLPIGMEIPHILSSRQAQWGDLNVAVANIAIHDATDFFTAKLPDGRCPCPHCPRLPPSSAARPPPAPARGDCRPDAGFTAGRDSRRAGGSASRSTAEASPPHRRAGPRSARGRPGPPPHRHCVFRGRPARSPQPHPAPRPAHRAASVSVPAATAGDWVHEGTGPGPGCAREPRRRRHHPGDGAGQSGGTTAHARRRYAATRASEDVDTLCQPGMPVPSPVLRETTIIRSIEVRDRGGRFAGRS